MKKTTKVSKLTQKELDLEEAINQYHSWNKYGDTLQISPILVASIGLLLGIAVSMIIATPSILQACN